jgi:hypothetical protein
MYGYDFITNDSIFFGSIQKNETCQIIDLGKHLINASEQCAAILAIMRSLNK